MTVPHSIPPGDVAYSYLRFSDPTQAKGDSKRRQTQGADEWCARNGVRLDTSTTLADLGKSGYKQGKRRQALAASAMAQLLDAADLVNEDRRGLAAFLALIRKGRVPRGAYLIIENLDRLSRDDAIPATHLLTGILLAGVRVVQLEPEQLLTDKSGPFEIMRAIMELSRGNSESAMKSKRLREVWGEKKRLAREEGKPLGRTLPGWLTIKGGKITTIPDHVATVRRIFELAAAGYGTRRIADLLTREGIPAPGRSGRWNRAHLRNILADRHARGEYQPRLDDGSPDGPVIKDFYPAIVEEDLFLRARAGADQRRPVRDPSKPVRPRRQRKPAQVNGQEQPQEPRHVNLFAGLLRNALDPADGFVQHLRDETKRTGSRRCNTCYWQLLNTASLEGRAPSASFPYEAFARGFLALLAEVDPSELLPPKDNSTKTELARLQGELTTLDARIAELVHQVEQGGLPPALADLLRRRQAERATLVAQLDKARQAAATPPQTAWADAKSLLATLDAAPDQEAARLKLRSLLRRIIHHVDLLIVPRGKSRYAFAQVTFRDSDKIRVYAIGYRGTITPPRAPRQPARYWATSHLVSELGDIDLTTPTGQDACRRWATGWVPEETLAATDGRRRHSQHFISEELPMPEPPQADDNAAS
jgi:DNA invertase Pin-like site-specific DNA recombinase